MKLISHRRNTKQELNSTPKKFGVEVDIRSYGEDLIIHHDPFVMGEKFEDWLNVYEHGTLILNVKEEGLESRLIDLMKLHDIDDYFFLDQSFPFLVKWSTLGEHRCAVRFSEFESIQTVLALEGKVDWVWVDCFTRFPLNLKQAEQLNKSGFKLCIVSPELQGRDALIEIPALSQFLSENSICVDAVCTKRPDIWEELIECS